MTEMIIHVIFLQWLIWFGYPQKNMLYYTIEIITYLFLDVGLFFNDIARIAVLLCQFNYKVETKFNWSCNKLFNEWITLKGVKSTNNIF